MRDLSEQGPSVHGRGHPFAVSSPQSIMTAGEGAVVRTGYGRDCLPNEIEDSVGSVDNLVKAEAAVWTRYFAEPNRNTRQGMNASVVVLSLQLRNT
jgi:hypothetical protein